MPSRDDRWAVPEEYEVENTEARVLIPHRWGALAGSPSACLASLRAFEERLNASDTRGVDRAIFSLCAGWPWKAAEQARELWSRDRPSSVDDRLLLGEVLSICNLDDDAEGIRAADVFRELWQERDQIDDPALVSRLGTDLARETPRRHRDDFEALEILEQTAPVLDEAPPIAAADFSLHLAIQHRGFSPDRETPAETRAFEAAFTGFESAGDSLGLAECALLEALRREGRGGDLRQPLEHAVYRYEACGRRAWAASVVCYKLVPLVAGEFGRSHARVRECLERAMDLISIHRGPDAPTDTVLRIALRLGMTASVSPDFGWQFSSNQRAMS